MLTTLKHPLYPNAQQQSLLDQQREEGRWTSNHFLAERRDAWEQRHASVRYYDQAMRLPALKVERRSLAGVQSQDGGNNPDVSGAVVTGLYGAVTRGHEMGSADG